MGAATPTRRSIARDEVSCPCWGLHRTHQHTQQEAAAEQGLVHLQIAYAQVAGPVLTGLAQRAPSAQMKRRFAHHLQKAAPEHAERILNDPAWEGLTTVLAEAEAAGH